VLIPRVIPQGLRLLIERHAPAGKTTARAGHGRRCAPADSGDGPPLDTERCTSPEHPGTLTAAPVPRSAAGQRSARSCPTVDRLRCRRTGLPRSSAEDPTARGPRGSRRT